jgi:chromosome segregation ATPase
MSQNGGERSPDGLAGLSLDDAVERVVARGDTPDADEVRRVLSTVTEDGVVTEAAAKDELAHLAKVVSTPETRVELAGMALSDARETAEPVAHLDVVSDRLAAFEARLDAVERRVSELGVALQSLVDDDTSGLYERADDIRNLTQAANRTQQAADELAVDIEEFERWLTDADVRADSFADEIDALEASLSDLADTVDAIADEIADETAPTPTSAWADTALRHRSVSLLFDDLRSELATLRTWPDTEGQGLPSAETFEDRLDDLRARWEHTGDRLDDLSPGDGRYDDLLSSFERALDDVEPPVDWGAVQDVLDEHRESIDGLA